MCDPEGSDPCCVCPCRPRLRRPGRRISDAGLCNERRRAPHLGARPWRDHAWRSSLGDTRHREHERLRREMAGIGLQGSRERAGPPEAARRRETVVGGAGRLQVLGAEEWRDVRELRRRGALEPRKDLGRGRVPGRRIRRDDGRQNHASDAMGVGWHGQRRLCGHTPRADGAARRRGLVHARGRSRDERGASHIAAARRRARRSLPIRGRRDRSRLRRWAPRAVAAGPARTHHTRGRAGRRDRRQRAARC